MQLLRSFEPLFSIGFIHSSSAGWHGYVCSHLMITCFSSIFFIKYPCHKHLLIQILIIFPKVSEHVTTEYWDITIKAIVNVFLFSLCLVSINAAWFDRDCRQIVKHWMQHFLLVFSLFSPFQYFVLYSTCILYALSICFKSIQPAVFTTVSHLFHTLSCTIYTCFNTSYLFSWFLSTSAILVYLQSAYYLYFLF